MKLVHAIFLVLTSLLVSNLQALPRNLLEPRQVEDLKAVNETLIVITGKIGTIFGSINKLNSENFNEVKPLIQADLEAMLSGIIDVDAKLKVILASPNLSPGLKSALESVQGDLKAMVDFLPIFIDKLKTITTTSALTSLLTKYSNELTQGFLALFKCYIAITLDFQGMTDKIAPTLELFEVLRPIIQSIMKKPTGLARVTLGGLIIAAGPKLLKILSLLAPEVSTNINGSIEGRELLNLLSDDS